MTLYASAWHLPVETWTQILGELPPDRLAVAAQVSLRRLFLFLWLTIHVAGLFLVPSDCCASAESLQVSFESALARA